MAPTPTRSRWRLHALAALWLALGYANLARGTSHAGVPYRPWAFDHHSYSDLIAMGGDRYFGGGRPTPYLEDRIEYPPLLAAALWLPSFVPGGPRAYFTVGYLLLALCGLVSVSLLLRIRGARAWWLAGTPALVYYGGLNWDLLPIALLLGALLALQQRAAGTGGALAALGGCAKLWPLALVPNALAWLARRRAWPAATRLGAAAALTVAAVNAPLAWLAPAAWSWFWRFNAGRGAENSFWEVLRHSRRLAPLATDAAFLNAVSAVPVALAGAAAAWAAWTAARRPDGEDELAPVRLGTALVLVVWITVNKVWSPQYALWAFAAGALAAAPPWLFASHAVVAALDYHVAFETRASRGLIHYFDALYTAEELVRLAVYVALAAWIARALWRVARATAPRRAGAAG